LDLGHDGHENEIAQEGTEKMSRKILGITLVGMLITLVAGSALACACCGCSGTTPKEATAAKKVTLKTQTTCPVMGGKIIKTQYVDVKGKRVYVCCPGCIAKVKTDPAKYLAKIKASGETPAPLLCGKCGELKGGDKCCRKEAKRCGCGAIKGSPGCCKLPEKGKNTPLCVKCGQIKGVTECCSKDAAKCGKCGLVKGSPGCCKI